MSIIKKNLKNNNLDIKKDKYLECKITKQMEIGIRYLRGDIVDKNIDKAIKYFRLAADQNNAIGIFFLAYTLLFIQEGPIDENEAVLLMVKAAEMGLVAAIYIIGVMSDKGEYLPQDHVLARSNYEIAAENGIHEAKFRLANLYSFGFGGSKDFDRAFMLYTIASEDDDLEARAMTGVCKLYGYGTSVDTHEGLRLLYLAAYDGSTVAMSVLEDLYRNGRFVNQDLEKASYYGQEVEEKGKRQAFMFLALAREHGLFPPKDLQLALKNYQQAAKRGDMEAILEVARLERVISTMFNCQDTSLREIH
jgi:TPR repeat protein